MTTSSQSVEVHLKAGQDGCHWAREHKAVAVVVDALRASATIAMLLQRGASDVLVVKEVGEAFAYRQAYPHTLLVGERGGLKVDGFDFGNSPVDIQHADMRDKPVVFTSTTGAQRLVDCQGAAAIMVGTTINASVVARRVATLAQTTGAPIVIIPAGLATDASVVAEEDWLGAVVLAARLCLPMHQASRPSFQHYQQLIQSAGLLRGFLTSSHGQQLVQLGFGEDVQMCAQVDLIPDIVPTVTAVIPLVQGGEGVCIQRGTVEHATAL
jgi:2-phosphosulfolactate phosphatase